MKTGVGLVLLSVLINLLCIVFLVIKVASDDVFDVPLVVFTDRLLNPFTFVLFSGSGGHFSPFSSQVVPMFGQRWQLKHFPLTSAGNEQTNLCTLLSGTKLPWLGLGYDCWCLVSKRDMNSGLHLESHICGPPFNPNLEPPLAFFLLCHLIKSSGTDADGHTVHVRWARSAWCQRLVGPDVGCHKKENRQRSKKQMAPD